MIDNNDYTTWPKSVVINKHKVLIKIDENKRYIPYSEVSGGFWVHYINVTVIIPTLDYTECFEIVPDTYRAMDWTDIVKGLKDTISCLTV